MALRRCCTQQCLLVRTSKNRFRFTYEFKPTCSCYTYFRKVANKVAALDIILCQYIKKKWLHIVIECFVVKKQLCQETQVLTINGTHIPINLEENNRTKWSPDFLLVQNKTHQLQAPLSIHSPVIRTHWNLEVIL